MNDSLSAMQSAETSMRKQAALLQAKNPKISQEHALNLAAEDWGYDNWRHFQVCLEDARQGLMIVRQGRSVSGVRRESATASP